MNMSQRDLRPLMLNEFILGHNASETSTNIIIAWREGYTCDRTVRSWFQKFRSANEILEAEEGRG